MMLSVNTDFIRINQLREYQNNADVIFNSKRAEFLAAIASNKLGSMESIFVPGKETYLIPCSHKSPLGDL